MNKNEQRAFQETIKKQITKLRQVGDVFRETARLAESAREHVEDTSNRASVLDFVRAQDTNASDMLSICETLNRIGKYPGLCPYRPAVQAAC